MNRESLLRGLIFLVIACLRPLRYVLRSGYETSEKGPKYFVYDID